MSTLLDRGRELVYVYPEERVYSDRGDLRKVPSDTPVALRVSSTKDRSQVADLPGQVDVHIVRLTTRSLPTALHNGSNEGGPGSTWMRVVYQGAEYDLNEPPRFAQGPSRASSHWEIQIRSRNNLDQISTPEIRQETLDGPERFGPIGGDRDR